ncbi:hypothetical protein PHMEG_00019807 [Phytophthora megakarya]|uniref:Reverse transcriptase n=1 Tax=Phytophthora megakarya TaxID=4795 RepID=A0A225VQQ1_9STRA|nr:hypothetical protein PHMEG_00019807 [Phytophthora megakarya]
MFDPFATDTAMQRYRADNLQRWAMAMTSYKYVVEHIRREDNTWTDMLSRWGCASRIPNGHDLSVQQLAIVRPISPLEGDDFRWPDMNEIRAVQNEQPFRPDM